jgi:electron transfer flavoprotein alpha subunit
VAGILTYSDKSSLAMELLTAAKQWAANEGLKISAVSINNDNLAQALATAGATTYGINDPAIFLGDTAAMASVLKQAAEQVDADIILLSSDRRGKELAGRLAQMLQAGCLTDVKNMQNDGGRIVCTRNVLGGATVATQIITSPNKVIALSPKAYPAAECQAGGTISDLKVAVKPSAIRLIGTRAKTGDSVDIEAAEVLVVVGQGVENRSDLPTVEQIALTLGGVVACSKPVATDKKWFGEERIVGLSGKICKPDLAIVLGVSGQVQFTVGIRDARIIISINNDEKAYMNQIADYFMVGDLKELIPELNKALD